MAQITDFFVGANSGEGFRNLFPEMVDIEDTYDLMVLKGGPGVGKNTFMREVVRAMEAESRYVLLDEPFTGMDRDACAGAMQYIRERQAGRTVIIAHHFQNFNKI